MHGLRFILTILLFLLPNAAWSQDDDAKIQSIHNIDLGQQDGPSGPNYSLIVLDVKKAKVPGARAHIIFRQFSKRVRLEFEASGIPYGKYRIGIRESGCPGSEKAWTILHEAEQSSTHLATEKSLPKHALAKPVTPDQTILRGMNVGLFQVKGKGSLLIDCKPIKN